MLIPFQNASTVESLVTSHVDSAGTDVHHILDSYRAMDDTTRASVRNVLADLHKSTSALRFSRRRRISLIATAIDDWDISNAESQINRIEGDNFTISFLGSGRWHVLDLNLLRGKHLDRILEAMRQSKQKYGEIRFGLPGMTSSQLNGIHFEYVEGGGGSDQWHYFQLFDLRANALTVNFNDSASAEEIVAGLETGLTST
jgi:hypothetical protein